MDIDEYESAIPDPLKTLEETQVGAKGMRVDREFFGTFVEKVKNVQEPNLQELYEEGKTDEIKRYIMDKVFEKPHEYFNLGKLRKALKIDRRVTMNDIIDYVFGGEKIKSKDELLEREFKSFLAIHKPESKYVPYLKNYLKAYAGDPEFRQIIDSKNYNALQTFGGFTMAEFKALNGWREKLPEYVKDYIQLNTFS